MNKFKYRHLLQIPFKINKFDNQSLNFHSLGVQLFQMLNTNIKLKDNKQDIYEENSISLVEGAHTRFELIRCCKDIFQNQFCKEFLKFLVYTLATVIILLILLKFQSNITYTTQTIQTSGSNNILAKNIPGIFPPLSNDNSEILGSWRVKLLSSESGPQNLSYLNYIIQFKHAQKKTDTVYITKGNCSGDLKMNWSTYGSSMYLTKYQSLGTSMTIPNLAKDEQCIKNGTQKFPKLIEYVSVWTVFQQDSNTSLFLLIQQPQTANLKSETLTKKNHVLILEKIQK